MGSLIRMSSQSAKIPRFFYRMPPRPCPYLAARTEQNIFTELTGPNVSQLYEALTQAGFRRSHNVAYRPACPGCQACIAVRVRAADFKPGASFRRILRTNSDLTSIATTADATPEQYRLFMQYVSTRHGDGEMADMSFADYAAMVEDSPLRTAILEYRDPDHTLIAACLIDRLQDGFSAVYSFYEPDATRRSLGSYIILDLIHRAVADNIPYVYLGYWINGSAKMSYKARFAPLEGLGADGWAPVETG